MNGRMLVAAAVFTLATASAASGAVIASAPAEHQYPTSHTMYCDIVNLNTSPKNVTVEIMDYNGNPTTGPIGPILLGPNQAFPFSETVGTGAWCRWTVEGTAKKWRAVAIYDNGTRYTIAIPGQ